jgi:hypothetical protein
MVVAAMALLAAGCGADAEPWSTGPRVSFVNGCVESVQADIDDDWSFRQHFNEFGLTAHDVCRCVIHQLEERYSESDFLILSPTEQHESTVEVVGKCGEELLDR